MNTLFRVISRSGDGHIYVIYALTLLSLGTYGLKMFTAMAIAFGIELPVYFIIKNSVKRMRPFEYSDHVIHKIKPPDRYSFPSGHTAAAFLVANFFIFQFPHLFPLVIFWASWVGFSRIYLRVHFPGDVLAGIILGCSSAQIGLAILF